jgi:tetratricopeptide (TPR) repeat protein
MRWRNVRQPSTPGQEGSIPEGSMLVRSIVCVLTLAVTAAACSDDSAVRDCQQPRNVKRQIEACSTVNAGNPKSAQAYSNRCQAYNQNDEAAKALPDCNMAIKLEPRNASAYNNRGWAYEIRKEYEAALKDYSKAIEINARFALAYANRGDVYSKMGEKDKAITEYKRALAIEPGNDVARSGLKRLGVQP